MKKLVITAVGGILCLGLMWGLVHKGIPVQCSFDFERESSGFIYALDKDVSILEVEDSVLYIDSSLGVLGYGGAKVLHLLGNYAYVRKGRKPPMIYLFDIRIEENEQGFSIINLGKKVREYDRNGVEMTYSEVPIKIKGKGARVPE